MVLAAEGAVVVVVIARGLPRSRLQMRKSGPGYCSCPIGVKKLVSSFAVSPEVSH